MKRLLVLLGVLSLQSSLWACMWDSDTLADEAQGVPDVVRVITGRFPRNPPLYYEMRLKRVTAELKATPTKLADYDDAAVACERLGQDDAAIVWMMRKQAYLQQSQPHDANWREQEYHYLANVGTFWAHRWLRQGADRRKLAEMKKARDYIAQAIQLNPSAHFGREKYQLMAMDWIIRPPKFQVTDESLPTFLDDSNGVPYTQVTQAEKGLSGLIVLGAGWESIDIFNALANLVEQDKHRSTVAYLGKLRCMELVDQGQSSLLPHTPRGKQLKILLDNMWYQMVSKERRPKITAEYKTLRAEAGDWQAQRTAYMMARLQAGRHPDTDPAFWQEWQEPALPSVYKYSFFTTSAWERQRPTIFLVAFTLLLSALACALLRWLRLKQT